MNDRTGQNQAERRTIRRMRRWVGAEVATQPKLGRILRARLLALAAVVVSVLVYSLTRTLLWGHDGWLTRAWNDGAGSWFPYWIFAAARWIVWIGLGGGLLALAGLLAGQALHGLRKPH